MFSRLFLAHFYQDSFLVHYLRIIRDHRHLMVLIVIQFNELLRSGYEGNDKLPSMTSVCTVKKKPLSSIVPQL